MLPVAGARKFLRRSRLGFPRYKSAAKTTRIEPCKKKAGPIWVQVKTLIKLCIYFLLLSIQLIGNKPR